jgi:hypothetical protein
VSNYVAKDMNCEGFLATVTGATTKDEEEKWYCVKKNGKNEWLYRF